MSGCIAKQTTRGRSQVWGVYDTERGSWPALVSGFGRVEQVHGSEEDAQAEADRLNRWMAEGGKDAKARAQQTATANKRESR